MSEKDHFLRKNHELGLTFPSDTRSVNSGACVFDHCFFCAYSPDDMLYVVTPLDCHGMLVPKRIAGISYINPEQTSRYHINIPSKVL